MKLTPWFIVLSLSLVACSGSKSAQTINEEPPQIELSDADEFIENPGDAPVDTESLDLTSDTTEATNIETMDSMTSLEGVEPVAAVAVETTPAPVENSAPVVLADDVTSQVTEPVYSAVDAGTMLDYQVQKNETLMMIAFKLYGDYDKWKLLAANNQETLKNGYTLYPGMTLKYPAPAQAFVWNPEGLPYLIKTGDTLTQISASVYDTSKKWKLIWDNNRPLIKDPNRIFAGFTIYYPETGREVAAEL